MRRFVLAVGSLLLLPLTVGAAERQHHLGVGPSFSFMSVRAQPTIRPGVGINAFYTYGLTDQFNLLGEVSQTFLGLGQDTPPAASPIRPGSLTRGAIGAAYVLDVLRWVPYGGVLVSGNVLAGDNLPSPRVLPGAEVVLGLDYQFNRHLVFGGGYRHTFFFTKMIDYPVYGTVFAKLEWQWGY